MQTIDVRTGRPYQVLIGKGLLEKDVQEIQRLHFPELQITVFSLRQKTHTEKMW